jgi:beta-aspartyl-dipeptidase (metallo-type)
VLPENPTVAGTVERDLAFITPVVGVKTAVSDHRSSQEGPYHLRNLTAQARSPRPLGA